MRSLEQLCKPRQSVFDRHRRDVVLDLTDLLEGRIHPGEFFEENYFTDGCGGSSGRPSDASQANHRRRCSS
jgi:hypothetical protein